jgi:hypothetical protein
MVTAGNWTSSHAKALFAATKQKISQSPISQTTWRKAVEADDRWRKGFSFVARGLSGALAN